MRRRLMQTSLASRPAPAVLGLVPPGASAEMA